jgi:hypothetical protein
MLFRSVAAASRRCGDVEDLKGPDAIHERAGGKAEKDVNYPHEPPREVNGLPFASPRGHAVLTLRH